MDSKNPAYSEDELLLRKIYDLLNESSSKKNSSNIYIIQEETYKNIKIHFKPVNKYKQRAKNIINKISI